MFLNIWWIYIHKREWGICNDKTNQKLESTYVLIGEPAAIVITLKSRGIVSTLAMPIRQAVFALSEKLRKEI